VTDPNANGMVFRFDGKTGASMGVFATGDPGDSYYDLAWGPDGNLYVGTLSNHIDRFDGATGASLGTLPTPQTGSTNSTTFGPDGLLYVSDYFGGHVDAYNIFTGDLVKSFYGLSGAHGLAFTNAGDILVSSYFSNEILKFENGSYSRISLRISWVSWTMSASCSVAGTARTASAVGESTAISNPNRSSVA
jgi:outer membrane protein assembly factor BamB